VTAPWRHVAKRGRTAGARPGVEERLLLGADLLHVELVDARVGVGLQRGDVRLDVGADGGDEHVRRHELARLFEVRRGGEDLGELTGERLVRPEAVRRGPCSVLAGHEADLGACVDGARAATRAVPADGVGVGGRGDEAVADAGGHVDRLRAEAGDEHRRRRRGEVVDAGVLDRVVAAVVAALAALPEGADDLDRLLEHLEAHVDLGPAGAGDVLVEGLAGPDAEVEAAVEQDGARRRGLGDDRRVDARGRAGHRRRDGQACRRRQRADHGPHERAVALGVVPGVVVVGDPQGVEAGRLRPAGLGDELDRAELLAGEEVADLHGRNTTLNAPSSFFWNVS